jgi:hypothetical protein
MSMSVSMLTKGTIKVRSAPGSVVCDAEERVEVGVGVLGVCFGCCVSAEVLRVLHVV